MSFYIGLDICKKCSFYLGKRFPNDDLAHCLKVNTIIDHYLVCKPGGKLEGIFWLEGGDDDAECLYHIEQLVKYNDGDDDGSKLSGRSKKTMQRKNGKP